MSTSVSVSLHTREILDALLLHPNHLSTSQNAHSVLVRVTSARGVRRCVLSTPSAATPITPIWDPTAAVLPAPRDPGIVSVPSAALLPPP